LFSFVFDFNLETIIITLQLVFVISTMVSYKIFLKYVNEKLDDWVNPQNKMWFAYFFLIEFDDECWIQKIYINKGDNILHLQQVEVYHSKIGHMISTILKKNSSSSSNEHILILLKNIFYLSNFFKN
jgi:hypothetical protein